MGLWGKVKDGARTAGFSTNPVGGLKDAAAKAGKGDVWGAATTAAAATGPGASHIHQMGRYVDSKFISGDPKKNAEDKAKQAELDKQRTGSETLFRKQREAADKAYFDGQQKVYGQYGQQRKGLLDKMDLANAKYEEDQDRYQNEAFQQANDARNTYKNLGSKMDSLMERSHEEASKAMTLDELADPNNRVAASTRALYENQANNERMQGQADFGVLSALGAKSAGLGMSGPMTVGQQMALMANSQQQAGEAYANTQRRMQSLRDQGLNMGFQRTDQVFAAGQDAQNRARDDVHRRADLESRSVRDQGALRGEQEGYGRNILGSKLDRHGRRLDAAGEDRDFSLDLGTGRHRASQARDEFALQSKMRQLGQEDYRIDRDRQDEAALRQARSSMAKNVLSTVGSVVGGIYGGPAGAAAGSKAGGLAPDAASAGSASGTAVAPPSYGGRQSIGLGVDTGTSSGYTPSPQISGGSPASESSVGLWQPPESEFGRTRRQYGLGLAGRYTGA